jgi:hypothetical protein
MIKACLLARDWRLSCRSYDVRAAVQQCLRCTVTPVLECGWQFRPVGRQMRMFQSAHTPALSALLSLLVLASVQGMLYVHTTCVWHLCLVCGVHGAR